jgi:catechol 2,3-dioxygenase-like lactoylglutathione lyase family enzyme
VHLTHLGLPVLNADRSIAFYSTYFGFDPATAQRYDDGTVIVRNADGFDLALHAGQEPGPAQPFLHFGFRLTSPDDVRAALRRVRAGNVAVIEDDDEPGMVSFKCLDPDGHRVEVYWEPERDVDGAACSS